MKNILLLICYLTTSAFAQEIKCGATEKMRSYLDANPAAEKNRSKLEEQTKNFINNTKNIVTIPVVVHIVYNSAIENISDSQIESQIEVLNKDFRRTNQDAWNTPNIFQSVAADLQINFCLAKQTPNGEPTNGILRKQSILPLFTLYSSNIHFDSLGGSSAWDSERYLNIWVCNIENGVLGWAQFPAAGDKETDGVVIDFEHFGTIGTAKHPYNLGRTTTHEIGHWLNLYHIWGDNNCGDDFVNDTPTQEQANYGCKIHPSTSCSNNGDMFMNFMDYTNDACMNSFTQGQRNRSWACLSNFRNKLLTSNGCESITISNSDAGIIDIIEPNSQIKKCASPVYPRVIIKNYGNNKLYTSSIKYKLDANSYQFQQWNGLLDAGETDTVSLSAVTTNGDYHSLSVETFSPNGENDINPSNDETNIFYSSEAGKKINIEITTDNYANETTWYLINQDGIIIDSGLNLQNNTHYKHDYCLPIGCYKYIIHDSFGDGFCCNFGNGNYTISLENNIQNIGSGTVFTFSDTTEFCITVTENDEVQSELLSIYPNPVKNNLFIKSNTFSKNTPIFAKLFNSLGQLIIIKTIKENDFIKMDELKEGIYFLQISMENRTLTRKIILNK